MNPIFKVLGIDCTVTRSTTGEILPKRLRCVFTDFDIESISDDEKKSRAYIGRVTKSLLIQGGRDETDTITLYQGDQITTPRGVVWQVLDPRIAIVGGRYSTSWHRLNSELADSALRVYRYIVERLDPQSS